VTLSTGIEYWGLTISVDLVHIAAAFLHEIVDKLHLSLSSCVIEGSLVKIVRLISAYSHLPKNTGHPDSLVVTLNQSSRKHRSLLIVGLVKKLAHIITMSLVLLYDLIDISFLNKVKEPFHIGLELLICSEGLLLLLM